MNKLYRGDCLKILRRLPDESVQCVVTSPPSNPDLVELTRFKMASLK